MSGASFSVRARVRDGDSWRGIVVKGQEARSLLALVEAGERGCTALEVSSWALRFAAYCFNLRTKQGLLIRTDREEHPGGWHGRHVLESEVVVEEIIGRWPRRAA